MIVDCFPFFAPYGEELLYLRVNLLKDYVDKFIIVESNKTHSGKPVERKFMEIARQQGLPIEKIVYVEHDIPDTEHLVVRDVDRINAGENKNNEESLYARVRERLQKDAIMMAMNEFKNDDIFIYGDADEIINPKNVGWIAKMMQQSPHSIVKIPLVYLQGRADFRVFDKDRDAPTIWMRAMFFATKAMIMQHTVNNIRCGNIPGVVQWPTQNNKIIQDMGWHFAWMGNEAQRQTKAESFAHAHDSFKWHKEGSYSQYQKFVDNTRLVENGIAPDGNQNHILKRYPHSELPQLIFETPFVKDFLLPEIDIKKDYAFNDCNCYWCEKLQWPLLYDLDGDKKWFEVPRSCSVTIKENFKQRAQVFRNTKKYQGIWMGSEKPIVIFTDPLERFISLINVYLTPKQRYSDYGKNIFDSFSVDIDKCTKQEKIDLFFKNLPKITSQHQVHHFHPQCRFVDTENFEEFTIVRKEDVNDFFGITEKLNVTTKDITLEDLSEEQIDFVKRIYKDDYEFIEKYGMKNGKAKNKRANG